MLSRLLTSTHPDDLKAANKLIKEMVLEVRSSPALDSLAMVTSPKLRLTGSIPQSALKHPSESS